MSAAQQIFGNNNGLTYDRVDVYDVCGRSSVSDDYMEKEVG